MKASSQPYVYYYDPKFSDRQVWANSVDPDQTAPPKLFAILSASFGLITLWLDHIFQFIQ